MMMNPHASTCARGSGRVSRGLASASVLCRCAGRQSVLSCGAAAMHACVSPRVARSRSQGVRPGWPRAATVVPSYGDGPSSSVRPRDPRAAGTGCHLAQRPGSVEGGCSPQRERATLPTRPGQAAAKSIRREPAAFFSKLYVFVVPLFARDSFGFHETLSCPGMPVRVLRGSVHHGHLRRLAGSTAPRRAQVSCAMAPTDAGHLRSACPLTVHYAMQQSKPDAPKASADASEKAGDGSGGDAAGPAGADSDEPAAPDKDDAEEDGAAAMEEGPADGGASSGGGTAAAAAAAQGSKDSYLLQPEDLKGEDLAAHTGQLDVMLEYLWQVWTRNFRGVTL